MTIGQLLKLNTQELSDSGIESAHLDCLILIEDELKVDRSYILAHLDEEITKNQAAKIQKMTYRRSKHEPLAYIREKIEFYGRNFKLNNHVLVPRPESETIIEILKKLYLSQEKKKIRVADVGTGSGCLGVTASIEMHNSIVDIYDISPDAIEIALANAKILKAHLRSAYTEDLLSQAKAREYDVLLANLPYIPDSLPINLDATYEPSLAIFAGDTGLDLFERFWQEVTQMNHLPTYIITESMPAQHSSMYKMAKIAGYRLIETINFTQQFSSL